MSNEIVDFYDSLGSKYLSFMYTKNGWTRHVDKNEKRVVAELLFDRIDDIKKEAILDLGMGPGRWSSFFIRKGFSSVYGVDVAPSMVKFAKKWIKHKHFCALVADIHSLPFKSNSFGVIFCFRTFKYLDKPQVALREIRRVLKPKGLLLLELSNQSLTNKFVKALAHLVVKVRPTLSLQNRWKYFTAANFYSRSNIERLLEKERFRVLVTRPIFVLPSVPLISKFTTLWIFLDKILFQLLPKNLFARSWVILARR